MLENINIIYILFGLIILFIGVRAFKTEKLNLQIFPGIDMKGKNAKRFGTISMVIGLFFIFGALFFS